MQLNMSTFKPASSATSIPFSKALNQARRLTWMRKEASTSLSSCSFSYPVLLQRSPAVLLGQLGLAAPASPYPASAAAACFQVQTQVLLPYQLVNSEHLGCVWKNCMKQDSNITPSTSPNMARTLIQQFIPKICQEDRSRYCSPVVVVRSFLQDPKQSFRTRAAAFLY